MAGSDRLPIKQVEPDWPTRLIVNPASRQGLAIYEEMTRRLPQWLNVVDTFLSGDPAQLKTLIEQGLDRGIRRFVIGGGDGTLSRAAEALRNAPAVMGVLPSGTGNTFAAGLGLPVRLNSLLPILASGAVEWFDLGEVTAGSEQRTFLNSVTFGVSQRLVELLTPTAKKRLGRFAWPRDFHRALAKTPPVWVKVQYADGEDTFLTRQFIIANGRTVAGPLAASPLSSGQDGLLEVFRLGGPSTWSMLRTSWRLITGTLIKDRDAHYRRVMTVRVSTEPSVPVDVDGDIWRHTPIACRVDPKALAVIVPRADMEGSSRRPLIRLRMGRLEAPMPAPFLPGQSVRPPRPRQSGAFVADCVIGVLGALGLRGLP